MNHWFVRGDYLTAGKPNAPLLRQDTVETITSVEGVAALQADYEHLCGITGNKLPFPKLQPKHSRRATFLHIAQCGAHLCGDSDVHHQPPPDWAAQSDIHRLARRRSRHYRDSTA